MEYIRKQHTHRKMLTRIAILLFIIFLLWVIQAPRLLMTGYLTGRYMLFSEEVKKNESREMLALSLKIQDLLRENAMLRATSLSDGIFARVAVGGWLISPDSFIIDRGSQAGIVNGDIVIAKYSVAVGFIDEVTNSWSRILLWSHIGQQTTVRGGAQKGTIFEIRGSGAGEMYAQLPASLSLKVGDSVWLGADPSLLIGMIDSVYKSPSKQFQELIIKSPLYIGNLTDVRVISHIVVSIP